MTLTELARAAGMSKAHLSRLESGERSFSLANLLALTTRLGVPVASILPASGDRSGDVVSSEGTGTIVRAANLQVRPLTRRADAVLQPFHVLVPVDRAWSSGATHPGEEWIYVLRGVLRVEHDDQTDILHKGDSIHLDATKPHRLVATVEAELIVVADSGT
jgi:transcriptional regulator with XRE-family HTH domain